jgi:DNA-binding NarL/FixJ family response regulator
MRSRQGGPLHTEFLTLTKIGRQNKFSDASWGGINDSTGASLDKSPVRILEVDDSEPFRSFVSSLVQRKPELQVVSVASDGLEAVQKTRELKPDLVLLDIGLPKLNGIEAARRIRKLVPESKIIFLSLVSDVDVVHEALSLGVWGYVDKVQAGSELLAAVDASLRGSSLSVAI